MKIKQIVYTPMTGIGNFKNDNQWLRYRTEIFQEYTLNSLKNQTEQGFIHLLSYTPKEQDSPIVYKLWTDEPQLKFAMSGLLYHDDRFGDDHAKNRDLVKRLKCLKVLESECRDADWIYFTRIDSDDMYHKDAFKEIMEQEPGEKVAFMFKTGYIYNKDTEEMATWEPTTCPPFYTICYPKDVFFNPKKHFRYVKGWRTHEDTEKVFKCKELSEGKYCVLVHGKNTTTTWSHPFRGDPINNKKLKYFT
jgi:hypothetical protein